MKLTSKSIYLVVLLLGIQALAHKECGTRTISEEEKRAAAETERDYLERNPGALARREIKYVSINWHHIYFGTPYLDYRSLDILLNATNEYFRDTGVQFYTGSVDSFDAELNNKPNWWNLVVFSTDDYEMRAALKIGNNRNLNIYLVNLYYWGGYSAFPQDYQFNPLMDGIALLYTELPQPGGDPAYIFVENMLFVHEIGHWMGLYHTFDGGCTDTYGDYVLDTPAEAEPHYDCPTNPPYDSCPALPGLDPVHNIMDYASWCRDHFTAGQVDRMINMFSIYRNDAIVNTTTPVTTGLTVTTSTNACPNNGYMRCISSTKFQTCANGQWTNAIPCALNTYCTPNGNYMYCSYTNPTGTSTTTTTTTTSTTGPLTTRSLTTNRIQSLTTGSSSGSCTVGATRCVGSQFQTCVYTYGTGGWIGGWGQNQNCAPGTSCTQYGTEPNTFIGCI